MFCTASEYTIFYYSLSTPQCLGIPHHTTCVIQNKNSCLLLHIFRSVSVKFRKMQNISSRAFLCSFMISKVHPQTTTADVIPKEIVNIVGTILHCRTVGEVGFIQD